MHDHMSMKLRPVSLLSADDVALPASSEQLQVLAAARGPAAETKFISATTTNLTGRVH